MVQESSFRVYLLTTHPHPEGAYERLLAAVGQDRFGVHQTTQDPEAADLILFVESMGAEMFLNAMRRHPLVRRSPEKCFCFCELPHQVSFLPGIYTSVEKRWHSPAREAGGFYLALYENPYVAPTPLRDDAPYLFSFVGDAARTPTVTPFCAWIIPGKTDRHVCILLGNPPQRLPEQRREFEEKYAWVLRDSQFVLAREGGAHRACGCLRRSRPGACRSSSPTSGLRRPGRIGQAARFASPRRRSRTFRHCWSR